ncbi:MAG TPA: hypothetical protein ENJ17_04675 [Gammaproteobacteria bacterium]|nr:hypothetical protein [Gammaproteobacteria bacterium]
MKRYLLLTVLFLLSACGSGGDPGTSGGSGITPQGARILGMDVKEVPDYATAYAEAMSLGVREVSVSLDWSLLEPSEGNYDNTLPGAIDAFYPAQAAYTTLVLRPLDTPGPRLPAYLAGKAFDDPAVITAFGNFLTNLHGQLTNLNNSGKLKWIHVGNEIDATLGSDSTQWAAWQTFFNAAKAKIESLWGSSVVVSSVVQSSLLANSSALPLYQSFLNNADAAVFTYYPLNGDFTVQPSSVVAGDFALMTRTIASKPIILQECGYPSGALNNSSEAQQADFITAVFDAWDTQRDRITLIDFAWQYDVAEATVDQWVMDYGMSGQPNEANFKNYLWTLGLGNNDGTDKQAMQRLRDELAARNWGS